MEPIIFYAVAAIVGLVYFALITLLKKVTKIQYFHGFLVPLVVLVFFVGMLIYSRFTDLMGWLTIGYFISSLWIGILTLAYGMAWFWVSRKKAVV